MYTVEGTFVSIEVGGLVSAVEFVLSELTFEVATFGVFQIGVTSTDVATDGIQVAEYYESENYWWGRGHSKTRSHRT